MIYSLSTLFWNKSYEAILSLITQIPPNARMLSLDNNRLFSVQTNKEIGIKKIALIIGAIPPQINKLSLKKNAGEGDPPSIHAYNVGIILNALPKTVTCLDLGNNPFGEFSEVNLRGIFKKIPEHISELILTDAKLNYYSIGEWIETFEALPKSVKKITLSSDEIVQFNKNDLIGLSQVISQLENITLWDKGKEDLSHPNAKVLKNLLETYPLVCEAYKQLERLTYGITADPVFPTEIIYEIVGQFLEEQERSTSLRCLQETGNLPLFYQTKEKTLDKFCAPETCGETPTPKS